MFRNYLKTAVRNLLRYKGFALLNIFSLTIGVVGCLMIGLFVWDEKQFDKSIAGGENIYRLYEERKDATNTSLSTPVPPAYAGFMQRTYPEVESTARIMMLGSNKYLMERNDKRAYEDNGLFVDSSFLSLFSLKLKSGNAATAFSTASSIVLTEELAQRYFATENPLGKTLLINKDTMEVKGVLAALPSHFHLQFRYLMPLAAVSVPAERMQSWGWHQFYTYVKLKPGADAIGLQNKLQAYLQKEILPKERNDGTTWMPMLQPLHDIHLKSADFVYDNAIRGNESYVAALTVIALAVLLIAGFNFVNLATARSFRRAKEIGVRKVVGAERRQLVWQFIGETVLLSLAAVVLAMLATLVLVPLLNNFSGKAIVFNPLRNPWLLLMMLGVGVALGMLAGVYPALVLSGFQPIRVLKAQKPTGSGRSWLRPALVVVQFTLSVLLIVCTLIVYRQTAYLNTADLGFNKEQVLYFELRGDANKKLDALKNELRQSPGVTSVTSGYGMPGDAFAGESVRIQTPEGEKSKPVNLLIGDAGYVKTVGLRLLAGRDFSANRSADVTGAFLINETAVKDYGYGTPEKALGQVIAWEEWAPLDSTKPVKQGRVIGVVQDFHLKSLHEKVAATVVQLYPQIASTVAVKLRPDNMQASLAYLTDVWNRFAPGYPFEYKFVDESFARMYGSEEKLSTLLWIFAVLAIVVGCLGLFGLAAFSAEQRTKEIGIRKVLGADVVNIVGLLSKNFLLLVLLSSAIAFPLAWWAMNSWLDDFPYRVAVSWWVFALALAAVLLVAFITVSFQSIKAAIANPVKSLRTE